VNRPARRPEELRNPREVWNARDYGLTGDGTTNDQPAFAALVEELGRACARDGLPRVIYCPPGAYRIAGESTAWRSGVSLYGAGEGATRFLLEGEGKAVALARFIKQEDGASPENPLVDCCFYNFEIDGSRVKLGKYDPRAKGLDLQYMERATFRDLHIHDVAATGLGCDFLKDSVFEGVYAMRCGRLNGGDQPGGAGIGIGIGGWGAIERTNVTDCIADRNATNGIFVELQKDMWPPPRGLKILGCHCTGNRFGISDWGADGLVVGECLMIGNREAGFAVSERGTGGHAGRGGILSGCVLDGNGEDGVSFDGTPGPYTLRGNRISNNRRHGYRHWAMKADDALPREIALDGNDIHGNGGDAIRFEREAIDACITGNRIRRNGGDAVALAAPMPGLWRHGNREEWTAEP
jgi:hypothetical protein